MRKNSFRHAFDFLRIYAVCLFIICFLAACGSTGKLKQFKAHLNKADYQWIADQEITCQSSDEGCNQFYLIKGDACFRLAKKSARAGESEEQEKKTRGYYKCAVTHLEKGISQTSDWEVAGDRSQYYENLCESLRGWQDLSWGNKAKELTKRLLKTSELFRTVESGHPAASYFYNSSRFTLLRKELLYQTDPPSLCKKLNQIIQDLEDEMPETKGSRYEANFQRILSDVKGAKQTVSGCE